MLANHYIDEVKKWGEKNGEISDGVRTKRGPNVIRMVRLFFEMQLDSDVKRKFDWEFFFFPFFSFSFFLISVPYKYLCTDIISINYIRRVSYFSVIIYLHRKKQIHKEDIR